MHMHFCLLLFFIECFFRSVQQRALALFPLFCTICTYMKILTTTQTRQSIKSVIDQVKHHGAVFGVGRRNSIDAVIIQFPHAYNKDLNDITNINAFSKSFDFLKSEPELYSSADIKKHYA